MVIFKKIKLNDIADVIDSRHETPKYSKSGYPMVRVTDIKPGFLKTDACLKVNEEIYRYFSIKHRSKKGDLVFSRVGSEGVVSLVNSENPFCLGQNTAFIIPKDKNNFLYYWLSSPQGRREIKTKTTGATQRTVSLESIKGLNLCVPDLLTRDKISSILTSYDDLIENNSKRIKVLEEMAQRLYTEWFVKFKFPGHEKIKMVDSGTEFGTIPEGWKIRELGELANDKRNQTSPSRVDENTPYVGLEHIPRRTIILAEWGKAKEVSSSKLGFKEGDILFGKIRPYFHKVVSAPIYGITSSDTIVIAAKEEKWLMLTLMCVSNDSFVAYSSNTSQGTKMPRADWNTLKTYRLVVPDEQVLAKYNSFVRKLLDEMNNLMFQNRSLGQMRDLLIPELVTGKIEINN